MTLPAVVDKPSEWALRGDYWLEQLSIEPKQRGRKPRFLHRPLLLNGHGVKIKIDRGTLLIRNGFTHYPQQQEEYRFFPRDKRLPSRIVIIDGRGSVSLDAMAWLATQGVNLIQLNWRGEVISTASHLGYAADPELVSAQHEIKNSRQALIFSRYLIEAKITNCIKTIESVFNSDEKSELAISRLNEKLQKIKKQPPKSMSELLALEGYAATPYFRAWYSHTVNWRGLNRKPIPIDWHKIGARNTTHVGNQFARHPINTILNYAYGMLENQVRTIVIGMGFDPTVGYMHAIEPYRPSFIFDLMEPLRPIIDQKIIRFIKSHIFTPSDFILDKMGVCKLHLQFARNIVKEIQDIEEIEVTTINSLRKLLSLYPAAAKKAERNITSYKARLNGRRN